MRVASAAGERCSYGVGAGGSVERTLLVSPSDDVR